MKTTGNRYVINMANILKKTKRKKYCPTNDTIFYLPRIKEYKIKS